MSRPLWTVATASSLGGSHRASGAPNQDAVASFETDRGLCVAVADGHGGARYVRSHDGSRIAVAVARQLCGDLLRGGRPLPDAVVELPRAIVGEWRRQVAADLAARPLSAAETSAVGPDPLLAYGATLLIVLVRDHEAVALQLGDGDVVTAWSDGEVSRPMPDDPRNVGGQTTSLCLADAATSFRTTSLDRRGEPPELVLLGSDGYGNSFADPRWHERVMKDVLDQRRRDGVESVAGRLSRWTTESARVGGDDTTVAVVFREITPVGSPAAAAPFARPVTASPATTAAATSRRGIRPSPVLGLVALAGAVGLLAGWMVRGDSRPSDAVGPATVIATIGSSGPDTASTTEPIVPTSPASTVASQSTTTSEVRPSRTVVLPQPSAEVSGDLFVNAGSALVKIDVLSADLDAVLLEPRADGGQIRSLITSAGLWSVTGAELQLDQAGMWDSPYGSPGGAGLGYSAGKVVVVWAEPGPTPRVAAVEIFDGASGRHLGSAVVRAEDEPPTVESDGPAQPEVQEGTP